MKLAMERAMLTSNSPRVKEIDERLEALQKELLKKANAKQGFEELADEIDSLREEKQDLLVEEANRAGIHPSQLAAAWLYEFFDSGSLSVRRNP